LKEIVGNLTTAVGYFNCERNFKNSNRDWREHLESYINDSLSLVVWDEYEYGFSGDHFWLHDGPGTTGKRVLLIYLLKTTIYC